MTAKNYTAIALLIAFAAYIRLAAAVPKDAFLWVFTSIMALNVLFISMVFAMDGQSPKEK